MLKRYTQTWARPRRSRVRARARARKRKGHKGERQILRGRRNRLFLFAAHGVNHHQKSQTRHADSQWCERASRPFRPLGRCNYVGRLALRHCVHLAVWLFHERPKTSAGGDRGRCRLRRTERYAQFDRRYNTIESITAALLPLSLSLGHLAHPRPDFLFLFFSLFPPFFFPAYVPGRDR